jgi:hypothetical protein
MKFAIILSALIDCFKREEAGLNETFCMEEMNDIFDCKTSEENPLRKLGLD